MTDQAVKELEKMGIKQPGHKAWDRCNCEDCTTYKLKLEIFQKGRELERQKIKVSITSSALVKIVKIKNEAIRETLNRIKEQGIDPSEGDIIFSIDEWQSLRRELLKGGTK